MDRVDMLVVAALPEEFDAAKAAGVASAPSDPGCSSLVVRLLIDLLVLIGLGLLLAVSLATAFVTVAVANRLVDPTNSTAGRWLLATVGFAVGVAVNTLLSTAVLTGLPRLRMPARRVVIPALIVAAGLELLKTVGRVYVQRTEANPTSPTGEDSLPDPKNLRIGR